MNTKNKKIQILRAIAICAVVVIHSYPHNFFGIFIRSFVNFAVALFFFLSGYLTKLQYADWTSFQVRRIKRILIPYLIWSLAWIVISGKHDHFFFKLLTGNILYPYYFVFVYIQFVLFHPLIAKILKSEFWWTGYLIQPVAVILLRYFGFEEMIGFSVLFSWFTSYYFGLMLGNHVYEYQLCRKTNFIFWLVSFIISIAESCYWYKLGNYALATTQESISNCLYIIPCLLWAYMFMKDETIVIKDNSINRLLVAIGDYSFGIFLIHAFIISFLKRIPKSEYIVFPVNSFLIIMISSICIFGARKLLGEKYGKYLGFY